MAMTEGDIVAEKIAIGRRKRLTNDIETTIKFHMSLGRFDIKQCAREIAQLLESNNG